MMPVAFQRNAMQRGEPALGVCLYGKLQGVKAIPVMMAVFAAIGRTLIVASVITTVVTIIVLMPMAMLQR